MKSLCHKSCIKCQFKIRAVKELLFGVKTDLLALCLLRKNQKNFGKRPF
jgi:hypothetical protein